MSRSVQRIELDAFLTLLRNRTANGVYAIMFDGNELPVSVSLQDSPSLIFTFTGAVTREKPLPQFGAMGLKNHVAASSIRLADPSLTRNDEMRLAWYAGHENFELQKTLPDLLWQMIHSLGSTRVAFVGGSGGGFAALYYSWRTAGSVAIVVNPQTNLHRYHWGHRKRYRDVCWPALEKDAPLGTVIADDLGSVYASQRTNTVIYIQIASDFFHLTRQCAPFIAALPVEYHDWLIVRIANWGVQGHQPAPSNVWIPWVVAALSAPETTATSIEATWVAQNTFQLPLLEQLTPDRATTLSTANALANASTLTLPNRSIPADPVPCPASRDSLIARQLARTAFDTLLDPKIPAEDSR